MPLTEQEAEDLEHVKEERRLAIQVSKINRPDKTTRADMVATATASMPTGLQQQHSSGRTTCSFTCLFSRILLVLVLIFDITGCLTLYFIFHDLDWTSDIFQTFQLLCFTTFGMSSSCTSIRSALNVYKSSYVKNGKALTFPIITTRITPASSNLQISVFVV